MGSLSIRTGTSDTQTTVEGDCTLEGISAAEFSDDEITAIKHAIGEASGAPPVQVDILSVQDTAPSSRRQLKEAESDLSRRKLSIAAAVEIKFSIAVDATTTTSTTTSTSTEDIDTTSTTSTSTTKVG